MLQLHRNFPVGSEPVLGCEALGQLQGPRRGPGRLEMQKLPESHSLHWESVSVKYPWALLS